MARPIDAIEELAVVRLWSLPGGEIHSLDDILIRAGYQPRGARVQADAEALRRADDCLLQLVRLAPTEPLAARIVLQRILPALCAISRRKTESSVSAIELLNELITNAWPVIVAYPTERRPRSVASNLVRDIGFHTTVRPNRRRSVFELILPSTDIDGPASEPSVDSLNELATLLRDAKGKGSIDDHDIELVAALIRCGRLSSLAAELNVTPRTVRNHRDAVVHRLRNFVAAA